MRLLCFELCDCKWMIISHLIWSLIPRLTPVSLVVVIRRLLNPESKHMEIMISAIERIHTALSKLLDWCAQWFQGYWNMDVVCKAVTSDRLWWRPNGYLLSACMGQLKRPHLWSVGKQTTTNVNHPSGTRQHHSTYKHFEASRAEDHFLLNSLPQSFLTKAQPILSHYLPSLASAQS